MAENKSKVRKIIIGTVIAIMVIAVAVTGAVLIKKSTQKKPEPETATKTSTLPVSTTSPYVVLSDIDTNFRIKQIIGRVVSDDMGINCSLVFGTTEECLNIGAGLHRTSSIPGYSTPPIIAGHCLTVFKGFEKAEIGMTITLQMPYGDYTYRISEIKVINKDDFDFAVIREPIKHAIFYTCYPFDHINSPKEDRLFLYCDYISGDRIIDDINFTVPADVTNKAGKLVNEGKTERSSEKTSQIVENVKESISKDLTKPN